MSYEITKIVWLEDIVEKLRWKHNVQENEVIEVLENRPRFRRKEIGHMPGEDVFAAFGKTDGGRLLSVFFFTRETREPLLFLLGI